MFDKHDYNYLKYVLRHKKFVFQAGRKLKVPLHQLIVHDWHKFLPSEWKPYVDNFYRHKEHESREAYYHNPAAAKRAFNIAWLKHLNRGPHHWQHWTLQYDDGSFLLIEIPDRFVREMVADWSGAGRAQGHGNDVLPWYEKNKHKMQLHPSTRERVEELVQKTTQW